MLLVRQYKQADGSAHEQRIEDDQVDRYLGFFTKDQVAKLQAGERVLIEGDYWQLVP